MERQKDGYLGRSLEVQAELQAVNAEYTALTALVGSLPEGQSKDSNMARMKKLEYRLFVLTEKSEDYGSVALIDREFDLSRLAKEIEVTNELITVLETRKTELN